MNLGDFYNFRGSYAQSLAFYLRSLQILEAEEEEHEALVASLHNNMGLVYKSIGSLEEAQKHFERALEKQQLKYN